MEYRKENNLFVMHMVSCKAADDVYETLALSGYEVDVLTLYGGDHCDTGVAIVTDELNAKQLMFLKTMAVANKAVNVLTIVGREVMQDGNTYIGDLVPVDLGYNEPFVTIDGMDYALEEV